MPPTPPQRFTHLILTAFNLRVPGAPGLTREWLEHRFSLFDRFCFPSVRGQSERNFRWLLYFDPDTPAEFKRRIDRYAEWPGFRPYFIRDFAEYRQGVQEQLDAGATHLITTTLDNDDALARDFVAHVQREFHGQPFELVNLAQGLRLHLQTGRLYRHRVETNPFITLIESANDPLTIRGCGPHNLMHSRFAAIRNVEREPAWLQVVHDRNIAATGIWGCRRVRLATLSGRFDLGFVPPAIGESGAAIGLENVRRGLERALIRIVPTGARAALRKRLRGAGRG